jgi:hypothetical protein
MVFERVMRSGCRDDLDGALTAASGRDELILSGGEEVTGVLVFDP